MKFSEAIRLGSMLGPQAHGARLKTYRTGFLGLFGPTVEATCALGGAFAAGGCRTVRYDNPVKRTYVSERGVTFKRQHGYIEVPSQWQDTINSEQWCPVCARIERCDAVIAHLNDDHRWTREQISEWVATIEAQEPHQAEAAVAVAR